MRENLKATKSFTYAGRALKAGDVFTASRGDARVLRGIGRALPYETAQAIAEVTKTAFEEAPLRKPRAKKEEAK